MFVKKNIAIIKTMIVTNLIILIFFLFKSKYSKEAPIPTIITK